MNHFYRNFLAPLKCGARLFVAISTLLYLLAIVGNLTKSFDLQAWMGLSSPLVWQGEVWRLLTYALLPPAVLIFILNSLFILMLGTWIERVWSAREFWVYSLLCIAGAGLANIVLAPRSPFLMVTNIGLIFGLFAACWRLVGHERVVFMGLWPMSIRTSVLICSGIDMLAMLPCAGILHTLIMLCGGLTGWLYLSLRWRMTGQEQGAATESVRMGHLEL